MSSVYCKPSAQYDFFASDLFFGRAQKGAGKLLRLDELFPFEAYRTQILEAIDSYRVQRGGKPSSQLSRAGRWAMDPVFMLKCIVVPRLYGKADQDFEQEMLQNRVLQHWLDICHLGDVPSHKMLWKYKEIFAQTAVLETVFADYVKKLQAIIKYIGNDAVIADSSFFEAPKQRNTREENEVIKKGKGSTLWNDQPMKKHRKDVNASWVKKRNEVHYGYKGHFLVCAISKLIVQVFPTMARVHDAKVIDQYLGWAKSCKREVLFFADAGYTGKKIAEKLHDADRPPKICEKGRKVPH